MLPPPPQPVVLFSLLIYSFGAFAYGVMLAFWLLSTERATWVGNRRASRFASWHARAAGGAITLCSFVWFIVNILVVINRTTGSTSRLPDTIVAVLALLFPPLIAHTVFLDVAERNRAISGRWAWFLALIYPASAAIIGMILLHLGGAIRLPRWFFEGIGGIIGALFAAVSIYAMLLMRRSRRTRPSEPRKSRSFSLWMNGLFVLALAIFVGLSFAHALGGNLSWVIWPIQTLAQSLPLAFLAVGTYYENRFDFFDVLVKRGLALVATIAVLTLCLAVVVPITASVQADMRPWVQALCLSPLVLLLPGVYRRAGRWLDSRWFGRDFATVDALRHLINGLSGAVDERDLIERCARRLSEIASAEVDIDLSPAAAARAQLLDERGEAQVSPGLSEDARARPDTVLLPVRVDGAPAGTALFSARRAHRPYFSEDRALLGLMLDVFGRFLSIVRMQERRQAAELTALRAQINPHFLFNALNSIAGLIPRNPQRADEAIERLADVFRYTLRQSESETATVREEIEFAEAYLQVEQARFGDRLEVDVHVDPDALELQAPALMLQTLVENAVKHGISHLKGDGRVAIDVRRDGGTLRLTVTDNGPGPAVSAPATGDGYGLRNVRDRLRARYGDAATFDLRRDERRGVTTAAVEIPL